MSQTGLSIRSGTLESVSSFASIEGRNTFLQSLEPEMCTWQDGSIHEKPRAQSFINYLKSWSQEEIDGWTKRMCPPYDYIIMRYANQYRHDIVVEYHTCTVPKFIYPLQ
jgi:tRNA U34 5-carboxymethylaminomethyl modifying enzyme MnmG/GidA